MGKRSSNCFFSFITFRIHPRTKHDVGYRLSRAGLAVAYNQKIEFQGPIVENVTYSPGDNTVIITYTAVSSIELRTPNGFEVSTSCCSEYIQRILCIRF